MNDQEAFWSGSFGDEYTQRNRVDWRARIPFWSMILDLTGARSVYEFGCNAGWNLSAMRRACPDVEVHGTDINEKAVIRSWNAGLHSVVQERKPLFDGAELAFTAGVLIHVAPHDLGGVMRALVEASTDYVLAVEYQSALGYLEEAIPYRGHSDRLWRRDYGALYQRMGLKLVAQGDPGEAFDRCTYWLLRKP